MTDTLERAIARFRPRPASADDVVARVSAAAFRAMALERLRAVERDLSEVKGRVNGLIFLVAGTVLAQVILKVVG